MKNFLKNRNEYVIPGEINIKLGEYTDSSILLGTLKGLRVKSSEVERSSLFLARSSVEIEQSIDRAMTIMEARVKFLLSSVRHLNRLKLSAPSSSTLIDVKMVNMSEGDYTGTVYSSSKGGLIFASTNSIKVREKE